MKAHYFGVCACGVKLEGDLELPPVAYGDTEPPDTFEIECPMPLCGYIQMNKESE